MSNLLSLVAYGIDAVPELISLYLVGIYYFWKTFRFVPSVIEPEVVIQQVISGAVLVNYGLWLSVIIAVLRLQCSNLAKEYKL